MPEQWVVPAKLRPAGSEDCGVAGVPPGAVSTPFTYDGRLEAWK
jgi:hypothetical protein